MTRGWPPSPRALKVMCGTWRRPPSCINNHSSLVAFTFNWWSTNHHQEQLSTTKNTSHYWRSWKVARYYDISTRRVSMNRRGVKVVKPRQIIMYILREDFQVSYPIGKEAWWPRSHHCHSLMWKIKQELKGSSELEEEIHASQISS